MNKQSPEAGPSEDYQVSEMHLAHLAEAVQCTDDAIISKSLDGIIKSWNPGAEKVFGYAAHEAIGSPISLIIPPERAAEEPEILARLRRGEAVDRFETTRIRKDGKFVEVALSISPVKDRNGIVIGACKIARDITGRKRAEEQIRLEQERLRATLTSIGDGVIVTDASGCVEFLNPVAEALTGWTQAEAKGQALETVFHIVNESSRQRVESPTAKAMREGMVVGLASHTVLIARNGTELAIDDSAAPIRNSNGATSGVILVFRDVSGLRAAGNMRAKLSSIVEGSDDAIIGKDLDGRITSWNRGAEKIFGYPPQEAIGRPITMLIPPDRLAEEAEILRRLRSGGRVDHFETLRLAKDHRKVAVSLTISPIHDSDGIVVGASKIARDITEKKRAERQLEEAHLLLKRHAEELERQVAERTAELRDSLEEMETFSSGLSHDMKAPLRAIESHACILREDHGGRLPPEAREMLDRVITRCRQLSRFVDNVLAYARLRTGGVTLEAVELSRLVPQVLEDYPHVKHANAEVTIAQPLLSVQGHENLLAQAIANLVSNGVKFVSDGKRPALKIWTEDRNGQVRLWVEDNGIGIAKEDQPRVFALFSRLPNAGAYDGTGIGLAVVSRAVSRMGGQVGLESTAGKGSRFWIELKAATLADAIAPPAWRESGAGLRTPARDVSP